MNDESGQSARILIVDDQITNVKLLERVLQRGGYSTLCGVTDPRLALSSFTAFQPDIVVLDMQMPHLDGLAVMKQLQPRIPEGTYLPILAVTGDITPETKTRALALGAKDFVLRPYDTGEMLLRIRNLLDTRFMHLRLQANNAVLEDELERRTRTAEHAHMESIVRLALAAEFRDDDTGEHTQRVGRLSARLAEALGLPAKEVSLIRRAAPLHDVGKIGIPDGILLKRGRLDDGEMDHMRAHTVIGAKILSGSRFPILQLAEEIALTHHEHWDGSGYVPGLEGEAIPLASRIVAVADVYDALTNARPYKAAWSREEALQEIQRLSGRHFDPHVAKAFVELIRANPHCALAGDPALDDPSDMSAWHVTAPARQVAAWRDLSFRPYRDPTAPPTAAIQH